MCYVAEENSAHFLEGLAAPTGVENPPEVDSWLVVGGWWLVVGGWWLVFDTTQHPTTHSTPNNKQQTTNTQQHIQSIAS
ncbi:MAG: hypothetical protein DSM106950_25570 [Stigonema ocellatum SAG 48.90 = DSM 106950]|nr:hypothetical protein [Stigonema ocellatum SAG 48.90 = DSM 106950]